MFFRLRDLGCAVIVAGVLYGRAQAQFLPPEKNLVRSVSGQFIVTRPAAASPLAGQPDTVTNADLLRLEPALLAVSAERLKDALWRQLEMNAASQNQWRGQIYLALHPAQTFDDAVTVVSIASGNGWNFRVELPDVLLRTRFTRAMTGVLLLEYASRNARPAAHSIEIPPWLVDGLSLQLLADGARPTILSPPTQMAGGFISEQIVTVQGNVDPLADARRILRQHPALTFKQLSWPTDLQLSGNDDGVYRASAQVFTGELLKVRAGPAHLRTMLETMPDFYNWQGAFQSAFHENFPRPVDVEKWWSLTTVSLSANDAGSTWTPAVSCTRLSEILGVPVELRSASNALPVHAEISLQAVINNWDGARQTAILQAKLHDLEQAQLRMAAPLATLTDGYRQALAGYLGQTVPDATTQSASKQTSTSPPMPNRKDTVKQLNVLDARRRQMETDILKPSP